ncbi:MAG: minor capsid protein [Pyrinomonadaceae bacterium]
MTIIEIAEKFKKALLARETVTVIEILSAYAEILKSLNPLIDALVSEVESGKISISKLYQLERYKILEQQIKKEIDLFALKAAEITTNAQAINASAALEQTAEMLNSPFTGFAKGAVENFVGNTVAGSPLVDVFKNLAPDAIDGVRRVLLEGVSLGYNPRKTASILRREFGINAARAATIARTETLRAYREATRDSFKKQSKLVKGWVWYATLSGKSKGRTCAVCWAMHGQIFDNDTPMGTHPNCRCTMLPYRGEQDAIKSGVDKFGELTEDEQRNVLGKRAFEEYKQGKVELSDFVNKNKSDKWGITRSRRPLKDILAEKEDSESNEVKKAVSKLLEKAKRDEPQITRDLFRISKSADANLVGLEDKFKSRESLLRKITDQAELGSLSKAIKSNKDAIRYTYIIPGDSFTDNTRKIFSELDKEGYTIDYVFNAWRNEGTNRDRGYRGVNLTIKSSQGQKFEIQLHTRESFEFKTNTHKLYEERRNPSISEKRAREIDDEMRILAKSLSIPKGIKDIK